MSMKKYNHALDYTVLALAHAVDGEFEKAGKLLLKASKQSDVKRAVAVLEASNQQAFDGEKAKIAAKRKGVAAPAARVKAASKTRVRAFDIGDDADMDALIDDGADADDEEVDAGMDDMGDMDDEDEGGDFDKAFASMLTGMNGKRK